MAAGKPLQLDGQYINPDPLNPTATIADAHIDFVPSTIKLILLTINQFWLRTIKYVNNKNLSSV
jgi:hypothetical protein